MWQARSCSSRCWSCWRLNGRTFHYLGFSLQSMQSAERQRSPAHRHARGDDAQRHRLLRARLGARSPRHRAPGDGGQAALHAVAVRHPAAARLPGPNRRVLAALRLDLPEPRARHRARSARRVSAARSTTPACSTPAARSILIAHHRDWFDQPLWAHGGDRRGAARSRAGFVLARVERSRRGQPMPRTPAEAKIQQEAESSGIHDESYSGLMISGQGKNTLLPPARERPADRSDRRRRDVVLRVEEVLDARGRDARARVSGRDADASTTT